MSFSHFSAPLLLPPFLANCRTLSPASSSIKAPWPNGKTPDARVRSLERRLAAAEVQLQTAQANLLAAYERADAADRDAEAARDLQQQLQVLSCIPVVHVEVGNRGLARAVWATAAWAGLPAGGACTSSSKAAPSKSETSARFQGMMQVWGSVADEARARDMDVVRAQPVHKLGSASQLRNASAGTFMGGRIPAL